VVSPKSWQDWLGGPGGPGGLSARAGLANPGEKKVMIREIGRVAASGNGHPAGRHAHTPSLTLPLPPTPGHPSTQGKDG